MNQMPPWQQGVTERSSYSLHPRTREVCRLQSPEQLGSCLRTHNLKAVRERYILSDGDETMLPTVSENTGCCGPWDPNQSPLLVCADTLPRQRIVRAVSNRLVDKDPHNTASTHHL